MDDVKTAEQEPVEQEQPRTVHHALADMHHEIDALVHASPSGTESAVVRMRAHLRELRDFLDPNSAQAKADAAKAQETKAAQVQAVADGRAADEARARALTQGQNIQPQPRRDATG
jgi:hypothetical protein